MCRRRFISAGQKEQTGMDPTRTPYAETLLNREPRQADSDFFLVIEAIARTPRLSFHFLFATLFIAYSVFHIYSFVVQLHLNGGSSGHINLQLLYR